MPISGAKTPKIGLELMQDYHNPDAQALNRNLTKIDKAAGNGGASVDIATLSSPGIVVPDGETITVDSDGYISVVNSGGGGGGSTDEPIVYEFTISQGWSTYGEKVKQIQRVSKGGYDYAWEPITLANSMLYDNPVKKAALRFVIQPDYSYMDVYSILEMDSAKTKAAVSDDYSNSWYNKCWIETNWDKEYSGSWDFDIGMDFDAYGDTEAIMVFFKQHGCMLEIVPETGDDAYFCAMFQSSWNGFNANLRISLNTSFRLFEASAIRGFDQMISPDTDPSTVRIYGEKYLGRIMG